MSKVVDIEQRRQALHPGESFIVQAPAGSGKTELLIQRYLRLLATVDAPEEVVAITFTRKAAAEMRGRVIKAMDQAREAHPDEDDAAQQSYSLAQAVLVQNQTHGWQLEHNPSRMRIQTIDSLCATLTRQMPVLSRFGAQPETLDDATELYGEAAGRTLAQLEVTQHWSNTIAVILIHLDNNLPRVRDMIATMLSRRDQWLRHVTGDIRKKELEAALTHIITSTLTSARQAFPPEQINELLQLLHYAAENLSKHNKASDVCSCLGLEKLPQADVDSLDQWRGMIDFLLTKTGGWRKTVNVNNGFPPASKNNSDDMKSRFKALLGRLSENEVLHYQLLEIMKLPPVAYTEPEWEVVEALCLLLILADAQLRVIFAEKNQIDFIGVSEAALLSLGDEELPTDLALNLDYKIQHLLVDEYQDISINQYVLLERLTAGWTEGDGHSLFLVGDPMQSIYRFREAEVGLFLNTWHENRLGQFPVTPITISVNFRSDQGIIDWVNHAFQAILPEIADVARGAVNYSPAVAYHDKQQSEAVTSHISIESNEVDEAARLIDIIQATQHERPDDDIAILVRSRTHLRAIVPALKEAGLIFRAVEIDALGHLPAIQDLIALTRALDHFSDRIAWLAILRAPWCGLSLEDLLVLAGDNYTLPLWYSLLDEGKLAKLSTDGRTRVERLMAILQHAYENRQRLDLRRWVESVWMKLGGPATLNHPADLDNTRTYFELLDEFDDGGFLTDRDEFMQQVNKLYAAPDTRNAGQLQIMTIHKAKGLEFDTVLLPGLSRKTRGDDNRLLIWSENPHRGHQDLLLAPVSETGEDPSPIYTFIKALNKEKQKNEDARLLYVAATRAKKRLHLMFNVNVSDKEDAPLAKPLSTSLLSHLWPVVSQDCVAALDQYEADTGEEEPVDTYSDKLKRLSLDWSLPDVQETIVWIPSDDNDLAEAMTELEFEWAGESIRQVGTVVHQYLCMMSEDDTGNWNDGVIDAKSTLIKKALQRQGVQDNELEQSQSLVREALKNSIKDERGNWILNGNHTEERNEYSISGVYKNKLVSVYIDKTFVDEAGTRWIIDYKSSRHSGTDRDTFLDMQQDRYRDQLEKYAGLMAYLDDRPIRLGLYFPLIKGWREWGYTRTSN